MKPLVAMATLPFTLLIMTFKEEKLSKATYVARTSVLLIIDVAVTDTLAASVYYK